MTASVRDDLERDLGCIDLLECIHGLNERDQAVFQALQGVNEGFTVDDVADRLECERSTAYRSISRLVDAGVVVQRQENYDQGGYYYVYRPRTPEEAAREMQQLLNSWYATVGQLIQEFEDRYGGEADERGDRSLQPGP
ncbi:helix-turn-helix domain-containing protein [Halorubrum ezzemoulense]|uniref:helix-turn-helix domain-containing protein n=1 Tax=Halorubrum TaxID=56688 RepID=UPI0018EEBB0B|nr:MULTISPECIES: helix-turn-helix domain-containing protein [Halorubrum]MDB9249706.1 helix-turn-helix domain-containing protein [Halorubrum ezzemoulense]MDB9259495.1 helix-turn-helix domain-containing protein [Halorubrum ezzemoulense]MDB9262961.1 helix-turn-helix domain-containing protein [Halorubrum ezzemoulense]MDB9266609.1 helix-turn-helix domain-containing protein [Halorubrum ezzemoulense]MDB9269856.1 helix-turn-helix domain-containing protein [Halorubrum ezzemoulense]